MIRSARLLAPICLLVALIVPANGQPPFMPGRPGSTQAPPFGQGLHVFNLLVEQFEMTKLESVDDLAVKPQETLLIVLGDTQVLDDVPHTFRTLVEKGGSVLVASDQPSARIIENALWVKIDIDDVPVTATDEEDAYRGLRQCPVISTSPRDELVPTDHPLFKDLAGKGIATNLPAYVHWSKQPIIKLRPQFVALYPQSCKINPWLARGDAMPIRLSFAALNEKVYEDGRILVLADHSVFINCMMIQDDNDNMQFAFNCLKWLSRDGAIKRVLILSDGQPVTTLEAPAPAMPMPNLDNIDPLQKVNELLAAWQDKNLFNQTILSFFSLEQILSLLALLVTAVVLVYGFFRLAKARHQQA